MVELEANGRKQKFSLEHAENILDIQNRNGYSSWVLTDKNYQLNKDGKLIRSRSAKRTGKSKEQAGDRASEAQTD